ncbi:MAG TPA: hypothetical protein VFC57_04665 [Aeromicrobium sp.]|nr:hypothetical protein [Aeromicrobium sp.]
MAGPNLVGVTGDLAAAAGAPALAGPFALATIADVLAALLLFVFLRPDHLLASAILDADDRRALPEVVPGLVDAARHGDSDGPDPGRHGGGDDDDAGAPGRPRPATGPGPRARST